MSDKAIQIRFLPLEQETSVAPGTRLLEATVQAGFVLNASCGGGGTCRRCRVKVLKGSQAPNEVEREAFEEDKLQAGWRLACQTTCQRAPIIVMAHGFTGVKEMTVPEFAERFVAADFVALAFDYRFLGDSEGEGRSSAFRSR